MRYKISIEYNGNYFHGWQKQKNLETVQGSIETALKKIVGTNVEIYGSGRTDAGVHAIAQVAHFDLEKNFPAQEIQGALNYYLKNKKVSVFDTENLAQSTFHARFDAKERSYIYKIIARKYPLTFQENLFWWIKHPLNTSKMQEAANCLIGTHDFSSFRAAGCQAKSPIKTINSINIVEYDIFNAIVYEFHIKAPSFLYHQVRNIVGSLYYVGIHKWEVTDFKKALKAKKRSYGGITAPAQGLYLNKIIY